MNTVDRFGCNDSSRRMGLLVDGEAPPEELELAERHFAECPACGAGRMFELAVLRSIRARLREVRMPPDLNDRILEAIRADGELDDDML